MVEVYMIEKCASDRDAVAEEVVTFASQHYAELAIEWLKHYKRFPWIDYYLVTIHVHSFEEI